MPRGCRARNGSALGSGGCLCTLGAPAGARGTGGDRKPRPVPGLGNDAHGRDTPDRTWGTLPPALTTKHHMRASAMRMDRTTVGLTLMGAVLILLLALRA